MPQQPSVPSPPLAVGSVILSMGLLAVGNGLLFAFIPVRLTDAGFPPWVAGTMVTSLAAGSLLGCLLAGLAVRRVGHARAFAVMTALVILSVLMIALGTYPLVWVIARMVYGFGAVGLFIISQSWINDACANQWRGKVIAIFYMVYVMAIGVGAFVLRFVPISGATVPLLAVLFSTLALLPVSLTRLQTPPPPVSISIAIRAVWRISPVGLVGLLAVGGMSMLLQGFGPIYVADAGYSKENVGLLIFLMQFGLIVVQYPLGALSDRIDRRIALVIACALAALAAIIALQVDPSRFLVIVIIFALWTGATESIYSVANAHANDWADPQHYVSLSSTMLVAWSVSALVLPAIATALTPIFGTTVFMGLSAFIALLYMVFVIYRVVHRESPADSENRRPPTSERPGPTYR